MTLYTPSGSKKLVLIKTEGIYRDKASKQNCKLVQQFTKVM